MGRHLVVIVTLLAMTVAACTQAAIPASQLFAAFATDYQAAGRNYGGREIKVTGVVQNLNDGDRFAFLTLAGAPNRSQESSRPYSMDGVVACIFQEFQPFYMPSEIDPPSPKQPWESALARISKGDTVTVKGIIAAWGPPLFRSDEQGSLRLRQCSIQ